MEIKMKKIIKILKVIIFLVVFVFLILFIIGIFSRGCREKKKIGFTHINRKKQKNMFR